MGFSRDNEKENGDYYIYDSVHFGYIGYLGKENGEHYIIISNRVYIGYIGFYRDNGKNMETTT